MTYGEMVHNYHKKKSIKYQSEKYTYTFADGSKMYFLIDSADKDITLRDENESWDANVMTKQFIVTTRTDTFARLEWFDGKRFNTIKSAINAIKRDLKGQ